MNTERDLQLIYELGMLRNIKRAWVQVLGPGVANLSEHHYRVAWTSLIIAKHERTGDHGKILKMALIHDLAESRTGDAHTISRMYTTRDEKSAITDILKDTVLEQDMLDIWQEYERRESIESKIVKDADTLDVDFELREHVGDTKLEQRWRELREKSIVPRFHTETAKNIWHMVETSDPNDWWMLGKNRHNAGDWSQPIETK